MPHRVPGASAVCGGLPCLCPGFRRGEQVREPRGVTSQDLPPTEAPAASPFQSLHFWL